MDIPHLFIHPWVGGHLDCFHFLPVVNNDAMNIHVPKNLNYKGLPKMSSYLFYPWARKNCYKDPDSSTWFPLLESISFSISSFLCAFAHAASSTKLLARSPKGCVESSNMPTFNILFHTAFQLSECSNNFFSCSPKIFNQPPQPWSCEV